ncbi:Rv2175c family DNA-binding protein [Rhizohabitans arisaemae]|uniref:Rv2175c family DNA-binding protein n=1 Tax=Rhizohabitans arisaemae TaxID=2720610 RepID=UPI0024B18C93|nr:Rv2175c family DNA-binding protein [Rhizohabitans arisaemae]
MGEWLPLSEVATRLGINLARAKQLLKDRRILGVHRGGREIAVPAIFISDDGQVLKALSSTLTVLADSGYDEAESLRWLFTEDDSLPGSPVQALVEGRHTEVKRRAQALAF